MHFSIWLCSLALCSLFAAAAQGYDSNSDSRNSTFWPLPTSWSIAGSERIAISPCGVKYFMSPFDAMAQEIVNFYLVEVFKCSKEPQLPYTLNIQIKDASQRLPTRLGQQNYELVLRTNGKWELTADYYVGFLRGLETYSQVFKPNATGQYWVDGLPIAVSDKPQYLWRGLMIDSSRHFLPVSLIKKTIDGLMFNKMSVLHWHITDEDSFPIQISDAPDLSRYGSLKGTYTANEISSIIQYAQARGVRIVPQIDSPAHTQSWARSQKYKDIALLCHSPYFGQFDPTLDQTYQVMKTVMQEINSLFKDEVMHLGGDEVELACWDKRPAIKEWMAAHSIASYRDLEIDYRKKQKRILQTINKTKPAAYWADEDIDLPLQDNDIIHWWGVSHNVDRLKGRPNRVILSNYDLTYLDIGYGGRTGHPYGNYTSWRKMYDFQPKVDQVNIIGGEACMWGETTNEHNFQRKVWTRVSVIGERLWNPNISINTDLSNIAARLIAHTKRMKSRGFKVEPVTVGLCQQIDSNICFPS